MTDVAIVGAGPWGLSVLERLIVTARRLEWCDGQAPVTVHLVDPGVPGVGAFALDDPDYLILNTPCGWHSVAPFAEEVPSGSRQRTFLEWLADRGYRWVGDECHADPSGTPIAPGDFLPRRLMGEYLNWSFENLVAEAPANVHVVVHRTEAVDVHEGPGGREVVTLAEGGRLEVDHVVLTTGHTQDQLGELVPGRAPLRPYPARRYADVDLVPAGSSVAIRGMGLVTHDILTALTIGRGGQFVSEGTRMRYIPSGSEPTVYLFSRSGYPYCAKSSPGTPDPSAAEYVPAILTPEAVATLVGAGGFNSSTRRRLDMRADVLPLLFAEMQVRYYSHAAYLRGGNEAAQDVRTDLAAAWQRDTTAGGPRQEFEAAIARCAERDGVFDAERHVFVGAGEDYANAKRYEEQVYETVREDVMEALRPGNTSAVKAAYSVPRVLRDTLRSLVEFRGLTAASHLDFQSNIRNRFARLIAGPPTLRALQLLALMDAGVVRLPFGPDPVVAVTHDGRFEVRSTHLGEPHHEVVDHLIEGTLAEPRLPQTASPLLAGLYASGRLRECSWGDGVTASVDLTSDFHPVGADGTSQRRLWIFGTLTEGVRYYTGYLPSPKDHRASLDASQCVAGILGLHTPDTGVTTVLARIPRAPHTVGQSAISSAV